VAGEVGRDHRLLAVLAAADVEQVVASGLERRADRDVLDAKLVAAGRRPPLEHGDVAAVGVDVEVLGVEVADPDDHGVRSLSQ
jgi:hypothetical protein